MELKKEKLKDKIKFHIGNYIKKGSELNNLIFTTFDFDTVFFENQLIPYLFDIPYKSRTFIKEKGILIAKDFKEKIEELNTKVSVYYDHFVGDIQANINYKAKEVMVGKGGIFHPKLVIINGKIKGKSIVTIMVMSANLTVSSYGTNIEVVGIEEIKDEELSQKIKQLESDNDNNIFEILNLINQKSENIFITGIGNSAKDIELQGKINNATNVKIITPFINKEVIENYNNKDLEIALTTSNIKKGDKEKICEILDNKENKINMRKVQDDSDRRIHAKLYILDDKEILIGSHNFTTSAIEGKNVECSYLINDQTNYQEIINGIKSYFDILYNNSIEFKEIEISDNEFDNKEQKSTINILDAKLDWKDYKIQICLDKSNENLNVVQIGDIILNNQIILNKSIDYECSYEYYFGNNIEVINLLYKSKFFKIETKDSNKEGYGIFYEINDKEIDKTKCINSDDYFEMLKTTITSGNAKPHIEIDFDDEENSNSMDNSIKNDNKYNDKELFIFYKELNEEIKNEKDEEKIINIYIRRPNSVYRIIDCFLNYLDKELDKDKDKENEANEDYKNKLLYFLLTLNEQTMLIKQYKNMDNRNKSIEDRLNSKFDKVKDEVSLLISKELKKDKDKESSKSILGLYLDCLNDNNKNTI